MRIRLPRAARTLPLLAVLAVEACVAVGQPTGASGRRATSDGSDDAGAAASGSDPCTEGQSGYDSYVEQISASLGAARCDQDGDCRFIVIDNPCSHGCGTAVAARTATALRGALDDYAATHCSACPSGSTGAVCPATEHVAYCAGAYCAAN